MDGQFRDVFTALCKGRRRCSRHRMCGRKRVFTALGATPMPARFDTQDAQVVYVYHACTGRVRVRPLLVATGRHPTPRSSEVFYEGAIIREYEQQEPNSNGLQPKSDGLQRKGEIQHHGVRRFFNRSSVRHFYRVRRRTSNSGVFLDLVRHFSQVTLGGFSILCGQHFFER